MFNDRPGRNNDVIRVRDALIEEVFSDRNVGYVTISYGLIGELNIIHINVVQLLVGQSTVIENQFGQEMLLRNLKKGMRVDAEFSNMMTASLPPQARAYRIVVLNENITSNTTTDRVIMVDVDDNYFITGQVNNINNQIRFNVSPSTLILDRRGRRIRLWDLRAGQMVRVAHANSMTSSIPPQTAAYRVQIV